jgi:vacuolar-type H+-ATPase subunit I/STV1
MIVSRSKQACLLMAQVEDLKRLKTQRNSIRKTFEKIEQLQEVVELIRSLLLVLQPRLPVNDIKEILKNVEQLQRELQSSRQEFERQPDQSGSLEELRKKAQKLLTDLKERWKRYAEAYTRETLDLYYLVSRLPEVQAQQDIYEDLKAQVDHHINLPPFTLERVQKFDACLLQLKQQLSNIKGLNKDVQEFLQCILKGQATLADLSDEVLDWCRQKEHARAFAIRFASLA